MNEFNQTPPVAPINPTPALVKQGQQRLADLYNSELYLGPWFSLTDSEKVTQMAAHIRALNDYEVRYRPASTLVAAVVQASTETQPT